MLSHVTIKVNTSSLSEVYADYSLTHEIPTLPEEKGKDSVNVHGIWMNPRPSRQEGKCLPLHY
jgi:hypothetical protein